MLPLFFKDKQGQWQVTPLHLFQQDKEGRWCAYRLSDPPKGAGITAMWQAGLLKIDRTPDRDPYQDWAFYIKVSQTERDLT